MNAAELIGVTSEENQEPKKHLECISVSAEGVKTIYYGGEIIHPDDARLTDAERAEIESAQYVQPSVPENVTDLQIRLALNKLGLREAIESAVAAGTQDLKDYWAYSKIFSRHNPLVLGMAASVGVNSDGLDSLFLLASGL